MENILKLGGKDFVVKVNFKKSFELTKYRNKITMGFDFSSADKDVVEEILNASQNKVSGKELEVSNLSSKALLFLQEKSQKDIFSYDEIIDIVKILTGLEDEEEINKLLDAEMEETDFDSVIAKLIESMNLVFTNVKGTSK